MSKLASDLIIISRAELQARELEAEAREASRCEAVLSDYIRGEGRSVPTLEYARRALGKRVDSAREAAQIIRERNR